MANYASMGSTRQSDDGVDDDNDEKDDTKRKSRNLSEKKRRDQFNTLVNELGSMVTANTRKMDKSTVLKSTILFLKNHNEISVRSRVHEIQENWKPSFLSNEEFTHLILEALDGFIMVFSSSGCIQYASESVTSLLGYLPSELVNATIYDITYQDDQSKLYNLLLNPKSDVDGVKEDNQVSFTCHIKRGSLDFREETSYELVQFVGYFRSDVDMETLLPTNRHGSSIINDKKLIFVGTGRLRTPQLIREMSFVDSAKLEFTSRHSLEWKFLFLDHRAPPIIGYLPFEVLGTSGYDYYHVDDLDKVVTCHESLMQKGEGTSCHYRFLTKGQQWIWLKTRFYIDYNQWNSKPEFIVCTHNVVSYTDVIKQLKTKNNVDNSNDRSEKAIKTTTRLQQVTPSEVRSSGWSPKSSKPTKSSVGSSKLHYQFDGSDTPFMLEVSPSSGQSVSTVNSIKTILQSQPAPLQHRRQNEDDQSSSSYADLQDFPNEPSLPIIPTQFVTPAVPTAPVPNPLIMNQPIVVMTNPQDQIQDELQRKHEELQQLIMQHQDELRRVSEQLLIARYGLLSPLINSSAPYNMNQCQSTVSNCNNPSSGYIANTPSSNSTQGMNILPLPMTLPVLTMPMEPFAHLNASMAANDAMMPQQQLIQRHEHQPQHHQCQPELMSHQEGHITPMLQYDLCPDIEISYANIDIAASAQPRLNNN